MKETTPIQEPAQPLSRNEKNALHKEIYKLAEAKYPPLFFEFEPGKPKDFNHHARAAYFDGYLAARTSKEEQPALYEGEPFGYLAEFKDEREWWKKFIPLEEWNSFYVSTDLAEQRGATITPLYAYPKGEQTAQKDLEEVKRLREALEDIARQYEQDGMENMRNRDDVIYTVARAALNPKPQTK